MSRNNIFSYFKVRTKAQLKVDSLITVNPYFVAIEEGKNISILCSAISPITSCLFNIPGEEKEIKLIADEVRTDGYAYYGDGFESGQCGITIKHINKENGGNITCTVDLNQHLSGIKAKIPVTITKELPVGEFRKGDEIIENIN